VLAVRATRRHRTIVSGHVSGHNTSGSGLGSGGWGGRAIWGDSDRVDVVSGEESIRSAEAQYLCVHIE
jgi:hypothetical protein